MQRFLFSVYCGAVVESVTTPACHAGGRGFKSRQPRHLKIGRIAQLGERLPYKQDVGGSSPSSPTIFYEAVLELLFLL